MMNRPRKYNNCGEKELASELFYLREILRGAAMEANLAANKADECKTCSPRLSKVIWETQVAADFLIEDLRELKAALLNMQVLAARRRHHA